MFDSWDQVGRVLLTGALIYAFLMASLRLSGKRTLAKLNAFDLVVTMALGSVLAHASLMSSVLTGPIRAPSRAQSSWRAAPCRRRARGTDDAHELL